MEIAVVVVVLIVIAALVAGVQTEADKKSQALLDSVLAHAQGFTPKLTQLGKDRKSGMSIDVSETLLCLVNLQGPTPLRTIVRNRDIVSVEIIEDGVTITKTSRASQAGGAIVGGALFGAAGAVVGSLTGASEFAKQVKRMDLRIVVDNVSEPIFLLNFQNASDKAGGMIHKPARKAAEEWLARIQVIIRRADQALSAV